MKLLISFCKTIWTFFKYPFYVLFGLFALLFLTFGFMVLYDYYVAKRRLIKGEHTHVKRVRFFAAVYNALRTYVDDFFTSDPSYFRHQGCIIFTGRQGRGKTIAMVEQCMCYQREYPLANCITNLNYKYQDDVLSDWRQLIDYKNGIHGVICLIDETQNWFSSNQSRNFPPEMLEVITQNRKNRRVILGTAQSFNRLAKPLREQATEVRKCFTVFGCFTFVKRVIPELDSNGDVTKWNLRGFYFFPHTSELRNAYDTYQVIESLRESGFIERDYLSELNVVVKEKE